MGNPMFIMMCGLESPKKEELAQAYSGTIVQKSNTDSEEIIALLQNGQNAIYDAQSPTKTERVSTLKQLRKRAIFGEAICVYAQTNVLEDHKKLESQNNYVPIKALLQDHVEDTQVPNYEEGWDRIITMMATKSD